MPKISVIIPVYNVEKFLKRCLDSVLAQTFQDFEVICVNDGSTDKSGEILDSYASKDSRIRVFEQTNQGASVARNNGLAQIRGDYIFFLDSDDVIHYQSFEILTRLLEDNGADMVSFDQLDCTEADVLSKSLDKTPIDLESLETQYSETPVFLGPHKGNYIIHFTATSKFFRKELLENISFIPRNRFEDLAYSFGLLSKNPKTVVLKKILYYYIINENGVFHTSSNLKQMTDYRECLEYIYDLFKDRKEELEFLKKDLIPNVLEQQRRRCRKASGTLKIDMYRAFAEELRWLEENGLLVFNYNRLHRYLVYKILMMFFEHE